MKHLLSIIFLLLTFTYQANAEVTAIADGSVYYCAAEEDDEYLYVWIIKASTGEELGFRKTLRNIKRSIRRVRRQLYGSPSNYSELYSYLQLLNEMKRDVIDCYNDGTTGKPVNGGGNPPIVDEPPTDDNPPSNPPSNPPGNSGDLACQVAGDQASRSIRIISGQQCSIGDTPVVYIEMYDNNGNSNGACTGTVVKNSSQTYGRAVLFAAHCAEGASQVKIYTGSSQYTASSFSYYPDWQNGAATEDGDVAIAKFSQNIISRAVRVNSNAVQVGEQGVIAGYGQDENGNAGGDRLKAGLVQVSDNSGYGIAIEYRNGGSPSNTCFGDSGGPLFVNRNGEWKLAGITSNGVRNDCGLGDTSLFANLSDSKVRNWINSVVPGLLN